MPALRTLTCACSQGLPRRRRRRAVKAARGLLKCDLQYIRGGALAILVDALGAGKAMPYVLKAVEEGSAEYRYAALQSLGKGDDKLFAQVAAGMPRYDAAAQAAVIGWLGECGAVSQADVITAAVASPGRPRGRGRNCRLGPYRRREGASGFGRGARRPACRVPR